MAGLSLVLANMAIPDCTASIFLDVAKTVLQDMSQKGNSPANYLKAELESICQFTRDIPGSLQKNSYYSIHQKTITIIRDGEVLNNAIIEVIESQPTIADFSDVSTSLGTILDASMEHQEPHSTQLRPAPLQVMDLESTFDSTHNNLPKTNDFYLEYTMTDMNDTGHMPTFSNEDLLWLDSVQ